MTHTTNLESVVRKSIAETVAEIIRNAILMGKIKPGEKLKEHELCKELNVSRTPLREAYRLLQSQNLVSYSPYVGVTVVKLTPRFVEEMWFIKSQLVPQSVALAAEKASPEQVDSLFSIALELKNRCNESPELFHSLDSNLHLTIASFADNAELYKLLTNIYDSTVLARSLTVVNSRSIKNSCDEHQRILDAIAAKDTQSATKHTQDHLERSRKAILANIS